MLDNIYAVARQAVSVHASRAPFPRGGAGVAKAQSNEPWTSYSLKAERSSFDRKERRKEGTMRRTILALTVGGAIAVLSAPAQALPSAACNQGTMNAHSSIPEMTGSGKATPGHEAVPEESLEGCGHGS